jgi:hypothetical protein
VFGWISGRGNSGSASSHAPPPREKKTQQQGESGSTSSPLLFLTGGDLQNKPKTQQAVDFSFFFFGFQDLFVFHFGSALFWFRLLLCFVVLCWWPVNLRTALLWLVCGRCCGWSVGTAEAGSAGGGLSLAVAVFVLVWRKQAEAMACLCGEEAAARLVGWR